MGDFRDFILQSLNISTFKILCLQTLGTRKLLRYCFWASSILRTPREKLRKHRKHLSDGQHNYLSKIDSNLVCSIEISAGVPEFFAGFDNIFANRGIRTEPLNFERSVITMVFRVHLVSVQIVFGLDEVSEDVLKAPAWVTLSLPLVVDAGVGSCVHHTWKSKNILLVEINY